METETRMVVTRDWKRGLYEELFNVHSVSDLQDEKALELCFITI